MLYHQRELIIRHAHSSDANSLQEIYRPYILNTNFNMDQEVPSLQTIQEKISNQSATFPFIVAEYNNQVVGFAYLSPYYEIYLSHTALLSIYTCQDCPVRGLGHELFTVLEFLLTDGPIEYIISSIIGENQRSIRFHEKQGFEYMLTLPQFGQKNNQMLDIVWMRKAIKSNLPIIQYQPFTLEQELDNWAVESMS